MNNFEYEMIQDRFRNKLKKNPYLSDRKGQAYEEGVKACMSILSNYYHRPRESYWIPVTDRLPDNFVSVLGYMTDAGPFPPVRECYNVGNGFFFPALEGIHSISHWMPLPEPPETTG